MRKSTLNLIMMLVTIFVFVTEIYSQGATSRLGIQVTPAMSYRYLHAKDASYDAGITYRNEQEVPAFGYGLGVVYTYTFLPWLEVETGIQTTTNLYKHKKLPMFGIGGQDVGTLYSMTFKLNSADVPLLANFKVGGEKVKFLGQLGIVGSYVSRHTIEYIYSYPDGTENKVASNNDTTSELNKIYASAQVGLGMDIQATEKINVRLLSSSRFGFSSIVKAPVKETLWYTGLSVGVLYNF